MILTNINKKDISLFKEKKELEVLNKWIKDHEVLRSFRSTSKSYIEIKYSIENFNKPTKLKAIKSDDLSDRLSSLSISGDSSQITIGEIRKKFASFLADLNQQNAYQKEFTPELQNALKIVIEDVSGNVKSIQELQNLTPFLFEKLNDGEISKIRSLHDQFAQNIYDLIKIMLESFGELFDLKLPEFNIPSKDQVEYLIGLKKQVLDALPIIDTDLMFSQSINMCIIYSLHVENCVKEIYDDRLSISQLFLHIPTKENLDSLLEIYNKYKNKLTKAEYDIYRFIPDDCLISEGETKEGIALKVKSYLSNVLSITKILLDFASRCEQQKMQFLKLTKENPWYLENAPQRAIFIGKITSTQTVLTKLITNLFNKDKMNSLMGNTIRLLRKSVKIDKRKNDPLLNDLTEAYKSIKSNLDHYIDGSFKDIFLSFCKEHALLITLKDDTPFLHLRIVHENHSKLEQLLASSKIDDSFKKNISYTLFSLITIHNRDVQAAEDEKVKRTNLTKRFQDLSQQAEVLLDSCTGYDDEIFDENTEAKNNIMNLGKKIISLRVFFHKSDRKIIKMFSILYNLQEHAKNKTINLGKLMEIQNKTQELISKYTSVEQQFQPYSNFNQKSISDIANEVKLKRSELEKMRKEFQSSDLGKLNILHKKLTALVKSLSTLVMHLKTVLVLSNLQTANPVFGNTLNEILQDTALRELNSFYLTLKSDFMKENKIKEDVYSEQMITNELKFQLFYLAFKKPVFKKKISKEPPRKKTLDLDESLETDSYKELVALSQKTSEKFQEKAQGAYTDNILLINHFPVFGYNLHEDEDGFDLIIEGSYVLKNYMIPNKKDDRFKGKKFRVYDTMDEVQERSYFSESVAIRQFKKNMFSLHADYQDDILDYTTGKTELNADFMLICQPNNKKLLPLTEMDFCNYITNFSISKYQVFMCFLYSSFATILDMYITLNMKHNNITPETLCFSISNHSIFFRDFDFSTFEIEIRGLLSTLNLSNPEKFKTLTIHPENSLTTLLFKKKDLDDMKGEPLKPHDKPMLYDVNCILMCAIYFFGNYRDLNSFNSSIENLITQFENSIHYNRDNLVDDLITLAFNDGELTTIQKSSLKNIIHYISDKPVLDITTFAGYKGFMNYIMEKHFHGYFESLGVTDDIHQFCKWTNKLGFIGFDIFLRSKELKARLSLKNKEDPLDIKDIWLRIFESLDEFQTNEEYQLTEFEIEERNTDSLATPDYFQKYGKGWHQITIEENRLLIPNFSFFNIFLLEIEMLKHKEPFETLDLKPGFCIYKQNIREEKNKTMYHLYYSNTLGSEFTTLGHALQNQEFILSHGGSLVKTFENILPQLIDIAHDLSKLGVIHKSLNEKNLIIFENQIKLANFEMINFTEPKNFGVPSEITFYNPSMHFSDDDMIMPNCIKFDFVNDSFTIDLKYDLYCILMMMVDHILDDEEKKFLLSSYNDVKTTETKPNKIYSNPIFKSELDNLKTKSIVIYKLLELLSGDDTTAIDVIKTLKEEINKED